MAGLPAFLGTVQSPHDAYCQIAGSAVRLPTGELRRFLSEDGALHDLLHRYTQATMVQLSQNVACNRLHTTEERCARWLLQTRDRVGADEFTLTQEFLAQMLGVRRAPSRSPPACSSRPASSATAAAGSPSSTSTPCTR